MSETIRNFEITPEETISTLLHENAPLPILSPETSVQTKGDSMFDLSEDRKAYLVSEIDRTADFFSRIGKEAYIAGGLSLSLGIENDIYRDQTDVDIEMDSSDKEAFYRYAKSEGYLVIDPVKGKQLFSPEKIDRRISLVKPKGSALAGPNLCEVYFFKTENNETILSAFLDLPFPKTLYDNTHTYKTENDHEMKVSPSVVQLVYKACYTMLYARQEDSYDFRRFVPKLTDEQYRQFRDLVEKNVPLFLDKIKNNVAKK